MEYVIDIESPSPAHEDFESRRTEIKNFVDSHFDEIKVSAAYGAVMEGIGVHRPGYKFQFWFNSEKLAEEFCNKFKGVWVIKSLRPPEIGFRTTKSGEMYYAPHLPNFMGTGYKIRRETQYGTQVRNSEDQEWQYLWDLLDAPLAQR